MEHAQAHRIRPRLKKTHSPAHFWQRFLQTHPDYDRDVPLALLTTSLIYLIAKYYFHLEVRGIENIPYGKRFVWTHNHSGWLPLDAPLIGYILARHNRANRFQWTSDRMGALSLVKHVLPEIGDWGISFWNNTAIKVPVLSRFLKIMHGVPVTELKQPENLKDYPIYATPAEGEEGSCKSSFSELYQLKRFRTGVARLAFETNVQSILPVMIMGPEESFLSLGPLRKIKNLLGTILPIPLPVPPLPVKWIVSFLPPINVRRYRKEYQSALTVLAKRTLYQKIVGIVKQRIGTEISHELRGRKTYLPWIVNGRLEHNAVALIRDLDSNGHGKKRRVRKRHQSSRSLLQRSHSAHPAETHTDQ